MTDILLIDSNENRAQQTADQLAELGNRVTVLGSAEAALECQTLSRCLLAFDVCVADKLSSLVQLAPTIVLAEEATIAAAVKSIRHGATDYLSWPLAAAELNAAIERASVYAIAAPQDTLSQFPLIGDSSAMQMLREGIGKVGPTDSPVLILGDSGTGKELVARAVHASSHRASAPLISINCATVPENLIEAELFGVTQLNSDDARGAGLVAAANGGTLFLDEIGELPMAAQAKLLQVMLGEHRKLGEASTVPVDIRVITATHRDLNRLVETGKFRQDLYYRLNVVSLELPPLRSRQDDALQIAEWLLIRTGERLNKSGQKFAPDAIAAIRAYHWPGNVRELENAIERAVILSDPDADISQSQLAIEPATKTADEAISAAPGELTSLEDYFVKFVQQHQDQLTETELAEKLGISRKSLWERRQRLNIPRRKTKKRGPRQDSASK